MFVFRAKNFLEEMAKLEPEILSTCRHSLTQAENDLDFVRLHNDAFIHCKDISVDYAVMEQTDKAWCVPLDCAWSDLGSWQSP